MSCTTCNSKSGNPKGCKNNGVCGTDGCNKLNVFNYLNKAKCFISSSLYEDPGFVLIEAGFLNKIVLEGY